MAWVVAKPVDGVHAAGAVQRFPGACDFIAGAAAGREEEAVKKLDAAHGMTKHFALRRIFPDEVIAYLDIELWEDRVGMIGFHRFMGAGLINLPFNILWYAARACWSGANDTVSMR